MALVELTDREVEAVRRFRLSPAEYAAEQEIKADARLAAYLATLTARQLAAWYTEQDRRAALIPAERGFEDLIRTRIRATQAVQRAPYLAILGRLGDHPTLDPDVVEEATELKLLIVVEDEAEATGGFIAWLRNLLGL